MNCICIFHGQAANVYESIKEEIVCLLVKEVNCTEEEWVQVSKKKQ